MRTLTLAALAVVCISVGCKSSNSCGCSPGNQANGYSQRGGATPTTMMTVQNPTSNKAMSSQSATAMQTQPSGMMMPKLPAVASQSDGMQPMSTR